MDSISQYFFNGEELAPHSLSGFKFLTTIIFYHVGQTPPDVQWRNREKKIIKSIMKRQVLFI